jgi:hypothetical protein
MAPNAADPLAVPRCGGSVRTASAARSASVAVYSYAGVEALRDAVAHTSRRWTRRA